MPYLYENSKVNFTGIDEFKETAIKTINEIYGRETPLDIFDFSEDKHCFRCVAYREGEEAPPEQPAGAPLSEEDKAVIAELQNGFQDVDDAELEGEANDETFTLAEVLKASDAAMKLAVEKGIDLKLVPGTGKDGNITKVDVENYLVNNAPETENADVDNEQSDT